MDIGTTRRVSLFFAAHATKIHKTPLTFPKGFATMKRYSAFAVAREAMRHHTGWGRDWRGRYYPRLCHHYLERLHLEALKQRASAGRAWPSEP